MSGGAALEIHHDAGAQRFLVVVEGHSCELTYARSGQELAITHTWVPAAVGGRGVAAALTTAALDYARQQRLAVDPVCSYAQVFLRRHPQYADLLRRGPGAD